jgi:hypothetical protein
MTPAVLDTAGVLAILLAMSVMWNRWHRCYDDSFPADGGPAEQAADIAETVLSGCGMTVVMVALFVLVLWWLWR